jgi:hypothetical protein
MTFRVFPEGARVDVMHGPCNPSWLSVKFNHDLHILTIPALLEDFTSVDAAAPAATIQR